ncbi:MAG: hypothetical protein methR_P3623 [Methyloprofundus sp.]|nr:MAG: hypothetical protein methR_P3623 [Methyloprofundus sp.]
MSTFNINLHEAIYSLSDALDLVGVDHVHHGKRVAFMAAECAKALNWETQQIDNLFQAAILHDCGVSNTAVHAKLAQFEWELEQKHCDLGAEILQSTPVLAHLADIILYHHTHWSALKQLDIPEEVKLHANCIYMVDRVDTLVLGCGLKEPNILVSTEEIRHKIFSKRDDWFHPELVDIFMEVSNSETFWLSLEREHISGYVSTWVAHDLTRTIDFQDLKSIVRIFSYIVDAKSTFTREHSDGVAYLSRYLAEQFELPESNCDVIEIAGLLHDIGKLRVPDAILDKPSKLTELEYQTMKRHSFDTYNILKQVKGFEQISQWAAEHHERVDATGYPDHKGKNQLSIEARIIAVADVFQALAQQRPYRKDLPPDEILAILKQQADSGHLDNDIVVMVEHHLRTCWEKALLLNKV